MYHGAAVVALNASTADIRCSPGSSPDREEGCEEVLVVPVEDELLPL
tara:strand:+ start:634 stop:774 length:141 start_codon:yes stop_codon:yes gene_type:complete